MGSMNAHATVTRLRPVAKSGAYHRFCAHRQRMLGAFAEWVTDPEDRPLQADVAAEAQATGNAVVQIAGLVAGRPK
jgi:hypothetical protein